MNVETELKITLPRELVTKLFQHAQETNDACGVVTQNENVWMNYRFPNRSSELTSEGLRSFIRTQIKKTNENVRAIYLTETLEKPVFFHLEKIARDFSEIFFFLITLNEKGVLEIFGYKFSENRWKKVVMELNVL